LSEKRDLILQDDATPEKCRAQLRKAAFDLSGDEEKAETK
jgi:hypothetical protein